MSASFPRLFEPIQLGPRNAPNRVMRLATVTNLAEQNEVGERFLAHYHDVARGGAGTIVTEALRVHPSARGRYSAVLMYRPEVVPGLRRLAEAVHHEGSLLVAQLNHGGGQHLRRRRPPPSGPPPPPPPPR